MHTLHTVILTSTFTHFTHYHTSQLPRLVFSLRLDPKVVSYTIWLKGTVARNCFIPSISCICLLRWKRGRGLVHCLYKKSDMFTGTDLPENLTVRFWEKKARRVILCFSVQHDQGKNVLTDNRVRKGQVPSWFSLPVIDNFVNGRGASTCIQIDRRSVRHFENCGSARDTFVCCCPPPPNPCELIRHLQNRLLHCFFPGNSTVPEIFQKREEEIGRPGSPAHRDTEIRLGALPWHPQPTFCWLTMERRHRIYASTWSGTKSRPRSWTGRRNSKPSDMWPWTYLCHPT